MLDPSIYVRLDQIKFAPGAEVWQGQDKTGDKKQGQVKGPLTGESYTQVSKSAEQAIRPKRESRHNYTNVVQTSVKSLESIKNQVFLKDGKRTAWREMPEIVSGGYLSTLSQMDVALQEALFEILSSEVTLCCQLQALLQFAGSGDMKTALTAQQRRTLFGTLELISKASEWVLSQLEKLWLASRVLRIDEVCQVLSDAALGRFDCYLTYLEDHPTRQDLLDHLRATNPDFTEAADEVQNMLGMARNLNLDAYMLLPTQRLTRYPLLVTAVLQRTRDKEQIPRVQTCLQHLQDLVKRSNALQALRRLEKLVDFGQARPIELSSSSRSVLREEEGLSPSSKKPLHLLLFNDIFMITKKQSDQRLKVLDYCHRVYVICETASIEQLEASDKKGERDRNGTHYTLVYTLLRSDKGFTVTFPLQESIDSWLPLLTPHFVDEDGHVEYASYARPTVEVLYQFSDKESDTLDLDIGDQMKIHKERTDGWCTGERVTTGEIGLFPLNYTKPVHDQCYDAQQLRKKYNFNKKVKHSSKRKSIQNIFTSRKGAT